MTKEEIIEQLSRETMNAQEAMRGQLAKFKEVGGPGLEDIRTEELAYLVLSLTVYALESEVPQGRDRGRRVAQCAAKKCRQSATE